MKTVLAASLIALVAAASAAAEPITTFQHYDWIVQYYPATNEKQAMCIAGTNNSDKNVDVIVHEDGDVEASFWVRNWGLTAGETYTPRVDVDYDVWRFEMTARTGNLMVVNLTEIDGARFVGQIMEGNAVALYAGDRMLFRVSLRGSSAAVRALDDCATTYIDNRAEPAPEPSGQVSWGTYDADPDRAWIDVSGDLTPEVASDFARVAARVSASYDRADVWLASDGGSLVAGLDIGEAIRDAGFSTAVPSGASCASSCALAWLGGTALFREDRTALVGFHQPHHRITGVVSPQTAALVGAYIARLGYSDRLAMMALQAAPDDMLWLDDATASSAGLDVRVMK